MSNPQIEQLTANARSGNPEAQFLLSQIRLQERDIDGMIMWLQKASEAGLPDALGAIGNCHEKGQGVVVDMAVAMDYYDRAVKAGSKAAAFSKAQLLYKSRDGAASTGQIRDLLALAAKANIAPALRALAYLAMQNESDKELALSSLRRATLLGDAVSAFMLGWCLLEGWGGDTSDREAVFCLQHATNSNFPFAAELLSSLGAETPEAPRLNTSEAIDFNQALKLYPELRSSDHEVYSSDPPITLYKDVLNLVDRAYLIYLSRPYLKRAHVIDPDGDQSGMVSDVRTSMSTYIPFEIVDLIGRHIELKIIAETNQSLSSSEPMSILRYAPGEYYRPHVDYFNPRLNVSDEFLQDGGQRTASAVTYLTAPTAGGGTSFPKLNITVPPVAGGTLWFRNCHKDGQVDDRSLHAGDTVIDGEKWVVTKWFREKPTQYLQI